MTGRQPSPRRSPEYAWLITTPLAASACVCLVIFWIQDPHWYVEWAGGLAALAGLVLAHKASLNLLIRRQNTLVVVTEIPLVLAIYFLPPPMVLIVATLGALITQLQARMESTKLWFNVAKSAASCSAALLVVAAFPPIRGAGPGTWGILFAAGPHQRDRLVPRRERRGDLGAGSARIAGGAPFRPAGGHHSQHQHRHRPGVPGRGCGPAMGRGAAGGPGRRSGTAVPVVRRILPAAPHARPTSTS